MTWYVVCFTGGDGKKYVSIPTTRIDAEKWSTYWNKKIPWMKHWVEEVGGG
jgi:hypothetical protein